MSTRSQVCAWVAAVGLLAPCIASGQDRTERDVVELIVRDGPQARALRAESEVARREQLARLAYPNPAFTYSREGAGFTEFFQAEQPLPIFGSRGAVSRAGEAAAAAAEAEANARLWTLRSYAALAAARLVAEQARLESARAQSREVERLIVILRTREQEGEGSRFDRLRAEQELRDVRQAETAAAAEVAQSRSLLAGMLPPGVALTTLTATPLPSEPAASVDALFSRATSARAELRAIQHLAQRATFEADAARKARLPAPTVFGGVKRADGPSTRETGGIFGVSVGVPLFDAGSREAARWDAERSRVEHERTAIESRIRSEIAGAAEVFAMRQATLAQDQPGAADELVQIAAVAYREGEVGILELLDAARTAARARIRSLELRLDARLAQIALERAVGEPLWP